MSEVSYIFGKTLTQHLETLEANDRYLELRVNRFAEEFLNSNTDYDHVDMILSCVYDYLYTCEGAEEMYHTLINLRQSIFWLRLHYEG